MIIRNRKQVYLTIGLLATVASLLGGLILNQQQIAANEISTTLIDWSVAEPPGFPDPIVMKKGETKVIPLTVMAPKEKPLNVRVGLVTEGEEDAFTLQGQTKLPLGISATLDKLNIDLPAEAGQGLANRGTIQLALTTAPNIDSGTYEIELLLVKDLDNGDKNISGHYLRIEVL